MTAWSRSSSTCWTTPSATIRPAPRRPSAPPAPGRAATGRGTTGPVPTGRITRGRIIPGRITTGRGRRPVSGRGPAMREGTASTRALVVEDDPNIVALIRSNLAIRGFDTVVSADGVRAMQLLETEEPDIVLLDLMLPEVDGFELCRQIRERSSVAVVVVSAPGGA